MPPPGPVKIGHRKDGYQRRPHRFHVSRPSFPAARSAIEGFRNITLSRFVRFPVQNAFLALD